MTPRRWTSTGTAALALAGAILLASAGNDREKPPRDRSFPLVVVEPVSETTEVREVRLSGVTRASDRARLAFDAVGRLIERTVDVGDRFEAGQLLARLDSRQLDHAVTAAEASLAELDVRLAQAERERDRTARLLEAKAATREELEQNQAAVDSLAAARSAALARLADARRAVGETVIRAPFDGTVSEIHAEPGEYVGYGAPVLTVSGHGAVELEVETPESLLPHLVEGSTVNVDLPVLGRSLEARVESVARSAAGPGRLFPVEVSFREGADVLAGMTAELTVPVQVGGALSVPLAAVHDPGGSRPAVFRVRDSRAWRVPVEIGQFLSDRVTVRGDLSAGDPVVVSGHGALSDGEKVEVRR